ncbi:MAG TPA: Uma2 family endonuclease [Thermoanaerobaculia bacterium]|nr:Uma2 family endonuclease [Thermoanaerobaculia bacterium]
MSVAFLTEPPLVLPEDLGPYRRQDYEALGEEEPRCELILGRFYVSPSPSPLHQIIAIMLSRQFDSIAETTGGIAFAAPLDVNLAEHSVVQPDILYISAQRRTILQRKIEGAPDLLVEILSPGTARRDRGQKMQLYADFGVREYWVVDAQERQIDFLVNQGGHFVVALPSGGTYRSQALPEVSIDLAAFWRRVAKRLGEPLPPE